MSERIKIVICALWIVHPVLQTAIAITMLRRRQHRAFKYFFAYIVAQIPINAVVFPAYFYHPNDYFYISSATTAISVALGFMAIYEAFLDVAGPVDTLRDLGALAFKWAGLLTLVVASVIAVSTRSSDTSPWAEAIVTAQRCVRTIQVGMVLFLLIFARYLGGGSRKQQGFGIALGFGIFAFVELGIISSWAAYRLSEASMGVVNMVAYNSALLIWLGYALKSPARVTYPMPRSQRWEQTLIDPLPSNSSVPIFEGMVDLDLSRSQVAPSSAIYKELSLLESELNENIKALKFTSAQISRRLGRLNILARNPPSRGESPGDT
jgi:hypothetical protein